MMSSALVIKQQIDKLVAKLIELGLASDQNETLLKQTGGHGFCVTFRGAENLHLALRELPYEQIYEIFSSKRVYTVRLLDGALLQMMYEFHHRRQLLRHRLAFLPSPYMLPFQRNPDLYWNNDLFADIVSRKIVPFPLRFDFDARDGVARELVHPKSHLTLGEYVHCRVPVTSALTPRAFVDFIIRSFYHTDKHQFADQLPGDDEPVFTRSILPREERVVHISTGVNG